MNTKLSAAARLRRFCVILLIFCAALFCAMFHFQASVPDTLYRKRGGQIFSDGLLRLYGESESCEGGADAVVCVGVFPLKSVRLVDVDPAQVVALGTPFGIRLYTQGVIVVGFSPVDTAEGEAEPARDAGLRGGDSIISVNGEKLESADRLCELTARGKPLDFEIKRGEKTLKITVIPKKSLSDGQYKAGIWVRDSTVGMGTMTFYDPATGKYAGLGHGVCDSDGNILPMQRGDITVATVTGIVKGRVGQPGELCGVMGSRAIGTLDSNTPQGVYGQLFSPPEGGQTLYVAMRDEVKIGAAQVMCTLDGSNDSALYNITIEKIGGSDNRNMVIKVTDSKLLKLTGGIVQGMSGSPIIQNGKLVGAVTHVLVNDPAKGYAVFADTMLAQLRQGSDGILSPAA